jgi:hypothetical protein
MCNSETIHFILANMGRVPKTNAKNQIFCSIWHENQVFFENHEKHVECTKSLRTDFV